MTNPTLQELNEHLFAHLLPATHARPEALEASGEAPREQPKGSGKGRQNAKSPAPAAATETAPEYTAAATETAPEYTAEQLAVLAAASITDPAAADPSVVKALLGN